MLNISPPKPISPLGKFHHQESMGMVKKVIQQGRSHFGARSVLPVRERNKMARTPLVAFFNIPRCE
ncbi:MAG: hypothetical protein WD425_19660 [Nitrospirales bacterium]